MLALEPLVEPAALVAYDTTLPDAVGTAKPVMFPENGPGGAEAEAFTPTRLGDGAPGLVGPELFAAA